MVLWTGKVADLWSKLNCFGFYAENVESQLLLCIIFIPTTKFYFICCSSKETTWIRKQYFCPARLAHQRWD